VIYFMNNLLYCLSVYFSITLNFTFCSESSMGNDVCVFTSRMQLNCYSLNYIYPSFSFFADTRLKVATRIGACLGIVKTKADYFCNSYKPAVKITTSSFVAGRVSLPRNVKTVTMLDRYVN